MAATTGTPVTRRKCLHPACKCFLPEGAEPYCGPYCRDAGRLLELACNCGHAECTEFTFNR